MNGFDCTFHDHTFATMMIGNGTDVRTVASYLGHSNVAMTLNTYAEVDPDAKRAAISKIEESFDMDTTSVYAEGVASSSRRRSSRSPSSSWRRCSRRREEAKRAGRLKKRHRGSFRQLV